MRKLRLLVIEDEEIDKRAIARNLKRLPLEVELHWVRDGRPALEQIRRLERPLVVLLDLGLLEMDGDEVLDELGDIDALEGVRLYVFTASDHEDDRADATSHHVDGYITKQSIDDSGEALRELVLSAWRELEVP